MQFIINNFGIAFVVAVEIDSSRLVGCKSYSDLYSMNCDMHEETIGYEYLITRKAEDEPAKFVTDFGSDVIKIEVERFISEYML